MTVIWAEHAYDDLDTIGKYLCSVSDEVAETTISRIEAVVLQLSEFPNMGAKIDDSGLRRLVVSGTPYVIFYRIVGDCVSIRGIFHTSQRRFLE